MNEDEPSNKKRKLAEDEKDEFSSASDETREDGELPDSDEENDVPLNRSTPSRNKSTEQVPSASNSSKPPSSSSPSMRAPITLPVKCPVPGVSGALRLPVLLPLPQMSTPKPKSCPVVLPFLPHMMKVSDGAPPIPLPKPPRTEEEKNAKELEECYSKTYSAENSEASDMEISDTETETFPETETTESQMSTTQVDSIDIPTGVNSEPSTGELQRTVIENPNFKNSSNQEPKNESDDQMNEDRESENDEPEKENEENVEYEYYTKEIVRHRYGTWVDSKDPIPDGWTVINHHSGFPVYMHKETRIVTWSRPYYIGSSNAKSHKVPLSAIPCLAYSKRTKPEETEVEKTCEKTAENPENVTEGKETEHENEEESQIRAKVINAEAEQLDNQQIKEYVKKRFEYVEIQGRRYKNQEAYNMSIVRRRREREENRRTYREERKQRKKARQEENSDERDDQDLPTLVKTCIEFKSKDLKGRPGKNMTLYLQGKTTVTILHEYCNRALKVHPQYEDARDELMGADGCKYVVKIDGKEYGSGEGANRTIAKNIAALETLKLLIPDFEPDDKFMLTGRAEQDYAYFNHLSITDNRLHQLCAQAGIPAPYQFLKDVIHKIHGPAGAEEKLDIKSTNPNNTTFTYTLGTDVVEGRARSKKNAKHIAAQAMLAKLHPEFKTWGDLLQHYKDLEKGKSDTRTFQSDKNDDEEQITTLFKEKNRGPNEALLAKLREMMQKVSKENESRFAESDRIAPLFCENRVQLNSNF
ncbi:Oidioi.mRNA.OKI2018_I69.chr1.g3550.t1.cds [Oikopleura dioica]|uniref:Oidioi.mRNA.OKI2018_I69.chr1.g3550.t1.cds n=1 Tax=Oikopleura dioica TaxID=34765 RepID=A0ABN7T198_OIKDI|nr:Oidioi.mRNA.OKI2018_I69.chr1.g3550.t1.cds [Oikopleura dioica]